MKKQNTLLLFLVLSFSAFAQSAFENGYFIHDSGERIECLIKKIDKKKNPKGFKYKKSEKGKIESGSIEMVQEFGIYDFSKHVRALVNIDRSSELEDLLSRTKEPEFQEELLFLNVLVDGKATLYSYEDSEVLRFFFKMDTTEIEQLIYKKFKTAKNKIGENSSYKYQLWNQLKCSNSPLKNLDGRSSLDNIDRLDYDSRTLTRLFVRYNACEKSAFTTFEKKHKDLININIKLGISPTIISIEKPSEFMADGVGLGFSVGFETELILPFNRNRWAILLEPTFQWTRQNKTFNEKKVFVDSKSLELPFGMRYYFSLNEKSKIFINAHYVLRSTPKSRIIFEGDGSHIIKAKPNFSFGVGYNHNNIFNMELRYGSSRELLSKNDSWNAQSSNLSILIGYNL